MAVLGNPQRWSGSFKVEQNLLPPSGVGFRFLGRPLRSLVAVLTVYSKSQIRNLKYLCTLY
jgi:hypothetical protein